jgi:ketosteroid isomerase-like protein
VLLCACAGADKPRVSSATDANIEALIVVAIQSPPWIVSSDTDCGVSGYVENIALQSADTLIAHKTEDGHFVIEYEVHGTILATGVKYNNRFCSIIKNRKITRWRDYMDSLAAWNALTASPR